jgi:hypothetical protein
MDLGVSLVWGSFGCLLPACLPAPAIGIRTADRLFGVERTGPLPLVEVLKICVFCGLGLISRLWNAFLLLTDGMAQQKLLKATAALSNQTFLQKKTI